MRSLQFDRPIAFIDLETTGLSVSSDRIVELTVLKVHPDGSDEFRSVRINPQTPIPAAATMIHGIADEDVVDKPTFRQYTSSLRAFLEGCDIGGFSVGRFDLPLPEAELRRAGVEFSRHGRRIVDVQVIYHRLEPRDLAAAYRKYCGKELEKGHTSEADVRAAVEILESQLSAHPELPRDAAGLHIFCNPEETNWIDREGKFVWSEGEAILSFGQYKGRSLKEIATVDAEYLQWIASGDFSTETKEMAAKALRGEFPPPQPEMDD